MGGPSSSQQEQNNNTVQIHSILSFRMLSLETDTSLLSGALRTMCVVFAVGKVVARGCLLPSFSVTRTHFSSQHILSVELRIA